MSRDQKAVTGGCACGALRYQAGPVRAVDSCHCGQCRRACGSSPVVWATVARKDFRWIAGEPSIFRSSDHGQRGFCGHCGSPLFFQSTHWPDEIDLTVGSLDRPDACAPERESFVKEKLSWVRIDPALPQLPGELPAQDD